MKVTITPQSAILTPETDIEIDYLKKWLRGHTQISFTKCEQRDIDAMECWTAVRIPIEQPQNDNV